MGLIFYARGDSSSANNSEINSESLSKTPTTTLEFKTIGPDGDYLLEFNDGASDPDTLLFIDGQARFFTVEFSGNLPQSNKFSNVNGFDLRGEEVVVITDEMTGQRYYFLTDPTLNTFLTMESMPNGSVPITNVSSTNDVVICFARGTRIETPSGPTRIENLRTGDLVHTEHGPKPIQWIGSTKLTYHHLAADPSLRPIKVRAHAFDDNVPEKEIVLSPNHRVVVQNEYVSLLFGFERALCAVKHLVDPGKIESFLPLNGVEYFHLMLEQHEIVQCNNLSSESLYLGSDAFDAIGEKAMAQLQNDLKSRMPSGEVRQKSALPVLKKHEASLLIAPNGSTLGSNRAQKHAA